VPPIADRFSDRPESAPSIQVALQRSPAIALTAAKPGSSQGPGWSAACGKTQLAVAHAERLWRERVIDLLVWADASSRSSILCGYVDALTATTGTTQVGDPESAAVSFLSWLAQTDRKSLVVLDDLADAEVVEGLWPDGRSVHVVVTTRNPRSVSDRAQCLEIGPFSRRDAMSYLVSRLSMDPEQRRGAIDLIEDLQFQPLALAQASAVIAGSWITCVEYRNSCASRRRRIFEATGAWPSADAVTWTIAAEQANSFLPSGAAQNCLVLAALLDGRGIPGDVFTTVAACDFVNGAVALRSGPEEQVRRALGVLERVGLLTIDSSTESSTVRLNRDAATAIRATMQAGAVQRAAVAAMAALVEAWPSGDQLTLRAQMFRSSAAAVQASAAELLWAKGCPALLTRAGQSMDEASLNGPAVSYWSHLAATSDRLLGPGHPDSLMLIERLAGACHAAGRMADAIAWHRRIVDDRVRTLGSRHPLSLAAILSLGRALAASGDFSSAVDMLSSTVQECEQVLGATHPDTIGVREELAAVDLQAGQVQQAVELYRRTLAERERYQGATNPDTMATRQKLAAAYLAGGRIKDALAQYKRALADREQAKGADNRDTLQARGSLAACYHVAGRMAKALQMYEETKAGCERVLGANDRDTLAACVGLARGYYAVGRLGTAAELLRDTVARAETVLPANDPLIKSASETLAAITG
jgi:tetratricopeptide (TPR) repeat protein